MTNNSILTDFTPKLLAWYKHHSRDLPWRNTNDPYIIWLSEIILQQTRVDQGMPYFFRFINEFPTLNSLAEADEQQVLRCWQGLGYYSRARNLHQTAKHLVSVGGQFPNQFNELVKLKGIGNYTAAAIASFAFNEAIPVVDGNVYRFISRLFALDEPVATNKSYKIFYELLLHYIPSENPGIFNQAIMEFGSLHCTPKTPDCLNCVFHEQCTAFQTNRVLDFPVKIKKTNIKELHFYFIHLQSKSKVWLEKREKQGIWKSLWHYPLVETEKQVSIQKAIELAAERLGLKVESLVFKNQMVLTHLLSHRRINAYFLKCESDETITKNDIFEIDLEEMDNYPMPQIMIKYLQALND